MGSVWVWVGPGSARVQLEFGLERVWVRFDDLIKDLSVTGAGGQLLHD